MTIVVHIASQNKTAGPPSYLMVPHVGALSAHDP